MRQNDDFDRLRRRVLWSMPSGLYIVGSRSGVERNGMTLNWATQVSTEPKHLAISVTKEALTHRLIDEGRVFSLCILNRIDRAVVRKFVKPVKVDLGEQTLNGFGFHEGVTGAPILDLAFAYLDCEVRQVVDVGDHTLFVGEILDAGFQQPESRSGSRPEGEESKVLRMEDTRMNYGG